VAAWPLGLAEAAAGAHQFAGNPLGIVGREERGDTSNIIHLTETAKRRLRDDAFLEVRPDEARGRYAFGDDAFEKPLG
jgi:hypothetical protein